MKATKVRKQKQEERRLAAAAAAAAATGTGIVLAAATTSTATGTASTSATPTPSTSAAPTPSMSAAPTPSTSATPTPQSADVGTRPPPPTAVRAKILKGRGASSDKIYDSKYVISERQLHDMVKNLRCFHRNCKGRVEVQVVPNRLDNQIIVKCKSCDEVLCDTYPNSYGKKSDECHRITEVNLEEVYHSINQGVGQSGLLQRVGFIGKDPITKGSYNRISQFLFQQMIPHYNSLMKTAHEAVFDYYVSKEISEPDENGVLDIDVSFDGTWLTRGHSSHVGVGFIMELYTGCVIDFEVLRNYCYSCKIKRGPHRCHKNYEGKAGAMEPEEARRLWARSKNYNFRYVTFVGDGDSASYKAVTEMNNGEGPYADDDIPVVKEECINHVHKRMGTRLRRLKTEASDMIRTRTGRMQRSRLGGKDKLTDKAIEKIQEFYKLAIRRTVGTTMLQMRNSIWAVYFHQFSSDDNPQHFFCPKEMKCFYNDAIEKGEKPVSHATKPNIFLAKLDNKDDRALIRQVFIDLTNPDLLQRCLKGRTQNPNESIHARLWKKCPKTMFFGLFRVRFACRITVLEHNFGYQESNLLVSLLGSNKAIEKTMETREKSRRLSQIRQKGRKRKAEQSSEYQPGNF